jgi:hypothetical protein
MFRSLVLGLALSLPLVAAATEKTLERAFETSTEMFSLPESLPGSIDARDCLSCKSLHLEVPATAKFFVGEDEVTLTELRDFARGKQANMVVLYEIDKPVVRRIIVSGQLPPRTPR